MISEGRDGEGRRFGNKSTFLEFVAILLPFISIPWRLKNQHIVLETDNIGCVFGWESLRSKEDMLTSILIRCLHQISFRLGSIIHLRHRPRLTSWESATADRMTRDATMSAADRKLLESFKNVRAPVWFLQWLSAPSEDWSLCNKMLKHVDSLI